MVTDIRGSKFEKMIPGIVVSSCSSVVAVHVMEEGRGNTMGWGLGPGKGEVHDGKGGGCDGNGWSGSWGGGKSRVGVGVG